MQAIQHNNEQMKLLKQSKKSAAHILLIQSYSVHTFCMKSLQTCVNSVTALVCLSSSQETQNAIYKCKHKRAPQGIFKVSSELKDLHCNKRLVVH